MSQQSFDYTRLTMGQKGLLITSLLMFIDLFLPWQRVCVLDDCVSASGWSGVGTIIGLLVIALLAWEGFNLSRVNVNLNVSTALVSAAIAGGIVLFTLLKVLIDNEFFSFGGWIGIILGLAMAYAGWVRYGESKGETLPPPHA